MDTRKFSIVFNGEIQFGYEIAEVKANLAKLFNTSLDEVQKIFDNKPVVIKKNLGHAGVLKYLHALEEVGVKVSLKQQNNDKQHTESDSNDANKKINIKAILAAFN